eukprot:Plantae.Rhodophyta-Purpureofilum_apyrenoidigerum.ctg24665.p1 GENE.Plantae.Rhodophyta-Purpureofilum_apyrenoidigerum.ctg24665~~Plantae.Rhodophyta-Purpureofilum_apyrenoidigerum.ctg24665.p1  ORF type:complete len:188 (+),score=48.70 Plantae.Rhodophyta-Purpureofilum_apyrenoidigerum.ctg24665:265-828(+)
MGASMGCLRTYDSYGVLMVGLDGAGSTTILYQMKDDSYIQTLPTLGVNNERLEVSGIIMEVYEIGGAEKVRTLWRSYSKLANGVIFVIDATNSSRFMLARDEIRRLFLGDKTAKSLIVPDLPLLVFLNKQDVPGCVSKAEIEDMLELETLPVRSSRVLECSGKTGERLQEGFRWLAEQLQADKEEDD